MTAPRVLVAGAGPVGLALGLALARAGVTVDVFEAQPRLGDEARASTWYPPTLEMLDEWGVAGAVLARGTVVDRLQFWERETRALVAEFPYRLLAADTRFPFRFQCPQHQVTPILHEAPSKPSDLALRPGRLLSHQEFRDLFSDEFLGADVQLAVGEQTILFTDIVGSTSMYAERGDPDAFVAVKHHFTTVFEIVGRFRGAVIKTIGDAAMGAFTAPIDALRAAEAIQRAFAAPNGLRLRVSLNTGSCIAVKLNANIDYFGHAVNLAAKLQALAEAGQVAVSSSTMAAPGIAAHLASAGASLEPLTLAVKGLREPVSAHRWTIT